MVLQVWDYLTGRIKKDLPYQAEEQFMMHDAAVLCLGFSADSELLVSGSQVHTWLMHAMHSELQPVEACWCCDS